MFMTSHLLKSALVVVQINDKFAKSDKGGLELDDAPEFAGYVVGIADLIDCSDHVGFVKLSSLELKVEAPLVG